jgi:hypothetical protein
MATSIFKLEELNRSLGLNHSKVCLNFSIPKIGMSLVLAIFVTIVAAIAIATTTHREIAWVPALFPPEIMHLQLCVVS